MSKHYWTTMGYGFYGDVFNKVSVEDKVAFIKKFLPDDYKRLQEACNENGTPLCDANNTEACMDFCDEWVNNFDYENNEGGFGDIFAKAINRNEEGIYVSYCCDCDNSAVIHIDSQPWEMTERERNMGADDMDEMYKKYLDEIHITAYFERCEVEYLD